MTTITGPAIFILLLQIVVSTWGMAMTWKLYKLLNHHNFWWVMSLGFISFNVATVVRFFLPYECTWHGDLNILYIPLVHRILFAVSICRILHRAQLEHASLVDTQAALGSTLRRLRELTDKEENGKSS